MDMKKMCGGMEAKTPEGKAEPVAAMECGCGCGPWMKEKMRGMFKGKEQANTGGEAPPAAMP